jgi:hypothetical protein
MLDLVGAQMIDVAGELAVQEGLGIVARGFDQAEVGQWHQHGLIARCLQLAACIAEIENLVAAVLEDGSAGFKKAAPVGIHVGSAPLWFAIL